MSNFARRSDFMSIDYNKMRRERQETSLQAAVVNDKVPIGLLKAARQSGLMNLSNKELTHLPETVWRVVIDAGQSGDIAMDSKIKENWWEVQEIKKLFLSDNRLVELSEDIKLLAYLNIIEARGNCLTHLPDNIAELKELRVANFAKNKLTILPSSLCECTSLVSLNLSGNQIDRIPSNVAQLTRLADLDLSSNQLMLLPEEIGYLDSLRNLTIESNCLTALPESLNNLNNLVSLNLSKNKLASLTSLTNFTNLEILEASENQILKFPLFRSAKTLKVLRLSHNFISNIPPDFLTSLVSLKQLDLRRNKLKELPSEITVLDQIERLDVTDNQLTLLPFQLGTMGNLKVISVEGNALKGIRFDIISKGSEALKKYLASRIVQWEDFEEYKPAIQTTLEGTSGIVGAVVDVDVNEVQTTKTLKYSHKKLGYVPDCILESVEEVSFKRMELTHNDLELIPEGIFKEHFNQKVEDLNLEHNRIWEVDGRLSKMSHLVVLNLSVNCLSDLPAELSRLSYLRDLNLTRNNFIVIPEVAFNLPSLENLILNTNKIEDVNATRLKTLSKLHTLDLSNNNIRQVPPELGLCTQLKTLQLEGNAFRVPRQAILAKGTLEILEYLRSRIVSV